MAALIEVADSGMTSTPVVEVMRVSRSFDELTVLTDVDFRVAPGHIHGLIGPNGVGKTTLLRIVAGLVDPTAGEVRVLGGQPSSVETRTRVGWIPGGDRTFYLRLSGRDNLIFFGRMYGMSKRGAAARSDELIEAVGLTQAGSRATGLYSKGMLKRLAVARALLPDPRLLLCDETTHDLDPDGAVAIRELIATRASEGIAVLWATQRLDELGGFADSVTVLSQQGVAFSGVMDDLLNRLPRRSFRVAAIGSAGAAVLDRLEGVEWMREHEDLIVHISASSTIGEVISALTAAGVTVSKVSEAGSTVEAAYRHVLGGQPG
jgi:ABC-2 type transport system ATP-binding protein